MDGKFPIKIVCVETVKHVISFIFENFNSNGQNKFEFQGRNYDF